MPEDSLPKSLVELVHDLQGLDLVVEEMAASFLDCSNCLGMGHCLEHCTNLVRCRKCFRSGHVKKDCTRSPPNIKLWVPKTRAPSIEPRAFNRKLDASSSTASSASSDRSPPKSLASSASPTKPPSPSQPRSPALSPPPILAPAPPSSMAVYELDPRRFLPAGHDIVDGGPAQAGNGGAQG